MRCLVRHSTKLHGKGRSDCGDRLNCLLKVTFSVWGITVWAKWQNLVTWWIQTNIKNCVPQFYKSNCNHLHMWRICPFGGGTFIQSIHHNWIRHSIPTTTPPPFQKSWICHSYSKWDITNLSFWWRLSAFSHPIFKLFVLFFTCCIITWRINIKARMEIIQLLQRQLEQDETYSSTLQGKRGGSATKKCWWMQRNCKELIIWGLCWTAWFGAPRSCVVGFKRSDVHLLPSETGLSLLTHLYISTINDKMYSKHQ